MIDIKMLFFQTLVLCLYIVPGILLRKMKFAGGEKTLSPGFPKGLSGFVLYLAQPCMMISPYIRDFDAGILKNMAVTFILSLVAHGVFIFLAFLLIPSKVKGAPDISEKVIRLAIIFSNCGYMGIPLIEALLGPEAAIYATVYNISFQMVSWSCGFYISSGDKKYISLSKIFINPAMISIYIGILIFVLPVNQYIPEFVVTFINGMKSLVLPLSLCVVGYHFGGNTIKNIRSNGKNVLKTVAIREIVAPVVVFAVLKVFKTTFGMWFDISDVPMVVAFICASTPSATLTSMLSEKFDLDSNLSGVIVPVSTIFSVITMPLAAMLLNFL